MDSFDFFLTNSLATPREPKDVKIIFYPSCSVACSIKAPSKSKISQTILSVYNDSVE